MSSPHCACACVCVCNVTGYMSPLNTDTDLTALLFFHLSVSTQSLTSSGHQKKKETNFSNRHRGTQPLSARGDSGLIGCSNPAKAYVCHGFSMVTQAPLVGKVCGGKGQLCANCDRETPPAIQLKHTHMHTHIPLSIKIPFYLLAFQFRHIKWPPTFQPTTYS